MYATVNLQSLLDEYLKKQNKKHLLSAFFGSQVLKKKHDFFLNTTVFF